VHISKDEGYTVADVRNAHLVTCNMEVMDRICRLTAGGWKSEHHGIRKTMDKCFDFKVPKEKSVPAVIAATSMSDLRKAMTPITQSLVKRPYINLYSVFRRNTIEYRTYWMTRDEKKLDTCLEFSERLTPLLIAGDKQGTLALCDEYQRTDFPEMQPFQQMENGLEQSFVKHNRGISRAHKLLSAYKLKKQAQKKPSSARMDNDNGKQA
jgi:hypothetical protein